MRGTHRWEFVRRKRQHLELGRAKAVPHVRCPPHVPARTHVTPPPCSPAAREGAAREGMARERRAREAAARGEAAREEAAREEAAREDAARRCSPVRLLRALAPVAPARSAAACAHAMRTTGEGGDECDGETQRNGMRIRAPSQHYHQFPRHSRAPFHHPKSYLSVRLSEFSRFTPLPSRFPLPPPLRVIS
ncbi:unnamed protein product [Closterium sp. Naga37s-1]|nr:unnamed protein product [Closterium sp. Naga37s-1]